MDNEAIVNGLRFCAKRPRYSCEGCKSYIMVAGTDEEDPIFTCDGKLFLAAADAIEHQNRRIQNYEFRAAWEKEQRAPFH